MSFPVGDWQFWAATALFMVAAVWLFRGLLPGAKARRKRAGRSATLTVKGRAVDRR